MQSVEAMISLLVFLSFSSFFLLGENATINSSVYGLQLADDVWRVLYLRGDLQDFNKAKLNADVEKITQMTGLCIIVMEEDIASCIPNDGVTIKRTIIKNGSPKKLTIKIGR